MPFGVDDIIETKNITNPLLKIAIIGEPKAGKSWFAATAPKPILNFDFDGRAASLRGKEGVYVKTFRDVDTNNPNAMAELEANIGLIEYEKQKGNPIPATFVLDSLTYMRSATEAEIIKQQSTLSRAIRIGSRTMRIGQGYDIINGNRAYIEYIIGRLSVLGNLIVVCHSMDEKDNAKTTKDGKVYTGKITIQPQYLSNLLSLFDDVWYLDTNWKGERIVTTGNTTEFNGSCSLLGLDIEEPADIEKMLAKSAAFIAKSKI